MLTKIEASPAETYDIELEHSLLEANAKIAKTNRELLDKHGAAAIDFMGAIGSGKTTLITRLVEKLKPRLGVAVFNGDATTTTDADAVAQQFANAHTKFVSSGLVTESDGQLGFRNALLVRDPDGHPILIEEK